MGRDVKHLEDAVNPQYAATMLTEFAGPGEAMHRIDYEDVSLTSAALKTIRAAGEAMLAAHAPAGNVGGLSNAKALALFLDGVYWDEDSGDLMLCSRLSERTFCLPIPRDQWGVRRTGHVH
ncbi:hypothetical protein [Desulfohalovibrio reitneri]|uniref:hypothetical protein n=1 Tax=Desulfohalovibrio reitneri TaxID=1307759 RepID=UPI000A5E52BC|nr:hypothetical protein [Desulfohalovibrio reitneri]